MNYNRKRDKNTKKRSRVRESTQHASMNGNAAKKRDQTDKPRKKSYAEQKSEKW